MKQGWLTGALTGVAACVVVLGLTEGLQAQKGGAGTTGKVASIDIVRVFNEYEMQKDLTEQIKKREQQVQLEAQSRRDKIDALKATLNAMNPTDPNYSTRVQELLRMQIDAKNWLDLQQATMQSELAKWSTFIYQEILSATEQVAKDAGYDFVFYRDEFDAAASGMDPDAIRNQIRGRKLVYANPGCDISQPVMEKLNAAHRAKPTKPQLYTPTATP